MLARYATPYDAGCRAQERHTTRLPPFLRCQMLLLPLRHIRRLMPDVAAAPADDAAYVCFALRYAVADATQRRHMLLYGLCCYCF